VTQITNHQLDKVKHFDQETVVAPASIETVIDLTICRPAPADEGPALVTKIENTAGTGVINLKLEFLENADGSGLTYEITDFNIAGNVVNLARLASWAQFLRLTYTAVSGNGAYQADVTALSLVKA